jgi:hypothetical protein
VADDQTEEESNALGYGCAVLFLLPFLLTGLFTGGMICRSAYYSVQMLSWQEAPARLHNITVHKEHDGDDGVSFRISSSYSYTFNGGDFTSSRVGFDDDGGFGIGLKQRRKAARVAAEAGKLICYVNPNAPDESVLYRGVLWDKALFMGISTLVFGGVGAGGFWVVFFRKDPAIEARRLKAAHPDEPWRQRADWESGEVPTAVPDEAKFFWFFSTIWNAISLPMLFIVPQEWNDGNKLAVIGLIFPVVGMWVLWLAIRGTLVGLKFGKVIFDMHTMPGILGGDLVGVIKVPRKLGTQQDIPLTLRCIRRESSGSGDSQSTVDRALWQTDKMVLAGELQRTGWGCEIPVRFTIPHDLPDSSSHNIQWRLAAMADIPGLDFATEFEIPVYHTDESQPEMTTSAVTSLEMKEDGDGTPADTKIRVMKRDGQTRISIPTVLSRRPRSVVGFSIFVLIWTGALMLQYKFMPLGVFVIFGGITGLIELLLLVVLWHMVFTRFDLLFDNNGVRGLRKLQIPASTINKVDFKMSSQTSGGKKTTTWYRLEIHHGDGGKERSTTIGESLTRQEAAWLKEEIETILTGG